jgi:DNA-directed RNA polymerase specialized sigma24 family protein
MSVIGSVSVWLGRLKAGDRAAVQEIWERYFHRLVGLARKKLGNLPRTASDEEDVALSAFASFCRRAEQGCFPRLDDRHDLWQVLVLLTVRKAHNLKDYEGRDKRDWRRNVSENEHAGSAAEVEEPLLARLIGREPDPAFAAAVAEQYRDLLGKLPDAELRVIAQRKLEGFANEEIAAQLDYSLATVERRLQLIRKYWDKELHG